MLPTADHPAKFQLGDAVSATGGAFTVAAIRRCGRSAVLMPEAEASPHRLPFCLVMAGQAQFPGVAGGKRRPNAGLLWLRYCRRWAAGGRNGTCDDASVCSQSTEPGLHQQVVSGSSCQLKEGATNTRLASTYRESCGCLQRPGFTKCQHAPSPPSGVAIQPRWRGPTAALVAAVKALGCSATIRPHRAAGTANADGLLGGGAFEHPARYSPRPGCWGNHGWC